MMAAAKATSSAEDVSWLFSNIEYETLSVSLAITFSANRDNKSAVVYKAREVGGNRVFAVKRYEPLQGARGALLKRLIQTEREINAAVYGGPHIVLAGAPLWNKRTSRMEVYMEHYEHRLFEWMSQTTEIRALHGIDIKIPPFYHTLLIQMLQALEFIHDKGIIHCAIFPQNIMFNNHSHFVLSEFTLAQYADKRPRANPALLGDLYMSPEVFDKKEITVATDLWTLGVVMLDLLLCLPVTGDRSQISKDGFCKPVSELAADLGQQCEMPEVEKMLKMSASERTSAKGLLEALRLHPPPRKTMQKASIGILYMHAKLKLPPKTEEDDLLLRTAATEQYRLYEFLSKKSPATSSKEGNVAAVPVQHETISASAQTSTSPSTISRGPSEAKPEELRDGNNRKTSLLQNLKASLIRQSRMTAPLCAPKTANTSIGTTKAPAMLPDEARELVTSIAQTAQIPATAESHEMNGKSSTATAPSLTIPQGIARSSAPTAKISSEGSQELTESSTASPKKPRKSRSGASKKKRQRMAQEKRATESPDVTSTQLSSSNIAEVPEAGDDSKPTQPFPSISSGSKSDLLSYESRREQQEPVSEMAESFREKAQQTRVRQAEKPRSIQEEAMQVRHATDAASLQATAPRSVPKADSHGKPTEDQPSLRVGGPKPGQQLPAGKEAGEAKEAAKTRQAVNIAQKAVEAGEEAVKALQEMARAREAIRSREETARALKAARAIEAARNREIADRTREAREEAARAKEAARIQRAREEAARVQEAAREREAREEAARAEKAVREREAREETATRGATKVQEAVRTSKAAGVLRSGMIPEATMAPKKSETLHESSVVTELAHLRDREKMVSTLPRARSTPDVSLILREQEVCDALEALNSRKITTPSDITRILERHGVFVEMPQNADATKAVMKDAARKIARALAMMKSSSKSRGSEWQSLIQALAREPIKFSIISLMTGDENKPARSPQAALPTSGPNDDQDPVHCAGSEQAASSKIDRIESREPNQAVTQCELSPPKLSAYAPAWDPTTKSVSPWGVIFRAYIENRLPPALRVESTDTEKYQAWLDAKLPAPPSRPHPEGAIYDMWAQGAIQSAMHDFSDVLRVEAQRYYALVRGGMLPFHTTVAQGQVQQAHLAQRPVNVGPALKKSYPWQKSQAGMAFSPPSIPSQQYPSRQPSRLRPPQPSPQMSSTSTFPSARPFPPASARSQPLPHPTEPSPQVESHARWRPYRTSQAQIPLARAHSTDRRQMAAQFPAAGAEAQRQRLASQAERSPPGGARAPVGLRTGVSSRLGAGSDLQFHSEGALSQLGERQPMPPLPTRQEAENMRRKWELAVKLKEDLRRMQEENERDDSR